MASPRARKTRLVLVTLTLCTAAALVAWQVKRGDRLTGAARRQWRDGAVSRVERRVGDEKWLAGEVAALRDQASGALGVGRWVGENLLVMRNGDWIVCEGICRKEDGRIHDLFIGRGSDGRWYYSTFHFCIGRVVLRGQRQPDSLAQFADAYWLAAFDGRSDDSLKPTWTHGPWGDEKLQSGMAAVRPNGSP